MRRQRSIRDLAAAVEAILALIVATAAVRTMPFRVIAHTVGLGPEEGGPKASDTTDVERAARIGWAVNAAARRLPWQTTCLMEAVAAAGLMRCHRLPATLHIGVGSAAGTSTAHAWLRYGDLVLTGADGHESFSELARYAPRRSSRIPPRRRGRSGQRESGNSVT